MINSAVVIGVVCYSGAMAALMVDVGQPLRAWFTFWYPNVHLDAHRGHVLHQLAISRCC